jgi:uncharacterized protein
VSVVSNAGPLIALARIGQLALLPKLYGEIWTPEAVYSEITQDETLPGAAELLEATWLRRAVVKDRLEVERLRFWLDLGESEALVLARERQETLLIDERRGRKIALTFGIQQTGTVGVLIAAKKMGLIPAVTPTLHALVAQKVRISPRLFEEARQLAGEA